MYEGYTMCEHCDNPTLRFKTIEIEGVSFIGHDDCMDDLVEMHQEGKYTVEDYIKELKK